MFASNHACPGVHSGFRHLRQRGTVFFSLLIRQTPSVTLHQHASRNPTKRSEPRVMPEYWWGLKVLRTEQLPVSAWELHSVAEST